MRVLIGYDGSAGALAAIKDLTHAGLPDHGECLVLTAVDGWLPPESEPGSRTEETLPGLADVRRKVLGELRQQLTVAREGAARVRELLPRWTVRAEACVDSPAWAIIKRAEGQDGGVAGAPADLVVVGSHGRGGLKRLFLGSVSHRVLTEARCSVRVARDAPTEGTADVDAARRSPSIVIAVDGSDDALRAAEEVAGRHWPRGTRALVVTVETWEYYAPSFTLAEADESDADDASVPFSVRALAIVNEAAEVIERNPALAVSTIVKRGRPGRAIVRLTGPGGTHPDCVFLGARGIRGLRRFLIGSVSASVASAAACSVEVVRPPFVPAEAPSP